MTFHVLGYGCVLATRRLALVQAPVDGLRQPQEYTIRAVDPA